MVTAALDEKVEIRMDLAEKFHTIRTVYVAK